MNTLFSIHFKLGFDSTLVRDDLPISDPEATASSAAVRGNDLIAWEVMFVRDVHFTARVKDFCVHEVHPDVVGSHVNLTSLSSK